MEQHTALDKALDVLWHLHRAEGPCGVSEIGRALALPKSTAHRLVAALGRRGFVERAAGGRYRPGMALVALGLGVLDQEPVIVAARPVLEDLARRLGETPFLAAVRGGRLRVLAKEEGRGFLRASPRVGDEIPVHATAVGKIHLAFAPGSVDLGRGGLEAFTPRTRVRRGALEREVARAREQGFARNREEWIPELCGVAAPVLRGGALVAALAVAGPASRVRAEADGPFVRAVVEAAARIGASLEGEAQ